MFRLLSVLLERQWYGVGLLLTLRDRGVAGFFLTVVVVVGFLFSFVLVGAGVLIKLISRKL